jgi:hypothetical protein
LRLFYNNLIDASGVGISSTSQASTSLAPANVAHEFKTKVWRTGTSVAAESITFDLLSAKDVTSLILFAHTLTGSDTSLELRASTDNFAASDVLIATLTYAASTIKATFSVQTYRYWRVKFTKSAAGESRDIGRIFLGTYYETPIQPDWDGVKITPKDLSAKTRSAGGQTYTDRRSRYRTVTTDFSGVSTTMKDGIKTVTDLTGTATSLFLQVDPNGATELSEIFYVKFTEAVPREADGIDASDVTWDLKMDFEEML